MPGHRDESAALPATITPGLVFFVVAHPDDELLACGGTLRQLTAAGVPVHVLICCRRSDAHNLGAKTYASVLGFTVDVLDFPADNLWYSMYKLGIKNEVENRIRDLQPSIMVTHTADDYNQDHRALHEVVTIAARPWLGVNALLYCEVPSATTSAFSPQMYVGLSASEIGAKLQAWRRFYAMENRSGSHPRSETGIRALAEWRGQCSGQECAEAYQIGFLRGGRAWSLMTK